MFEMYSGTRDKSRAVLINTLGQKQNTAAVCTSSAVPRSLKQRIRCPIWYRQARTHNARADGSLQMTQWKNPHMMRRASLPHAQLDGNTMNCLPTCPQCSYDSGKCVRTVRIARACVPHEIQPLDDPLPKAPSRLPPQISPRPRTLVRREPHHNSLCTPALLATPSTTRYDNIFWASKMRFSFVFATPGVDSRTTARRIDAKLEHSGVRVYGSVLRASERWEMRF